MAFAIALELSKCKLPSLDSSTIPSQLPILSIGCPSFSFADRRKLFPSPPRSAAFRLVLGSKMMKMKTKTTGLSQMKGSSAVGDAGGEPRPMDWELRPGGMLVQKRTPDSDRESTPPPTIRVKVKYGSNYHEISISSQATFGKHQKSDLF